MADPSFRSTFADNEFDLEIDDSQVIHLFGEGRQHPGEPTEAHPSPILVLSRYSALIETVRKAAPRGVPVVQANDLEHAAEKMPSLRPGVLIADTASTAHIAPMVAKLAQHFPHLVVVVAGQREDSVALTQITAYTQIFRFLLVPLSHGQTRLTLEAAIAQHKRLSAPPPPMDERRAPETGEKKALVTHRSALAAGLGAGLALLLGTIWWSVSHMTSEPAAPVTEATTTTARPTNATVDRPDPLETELALAQDAFARGQYVEPTGESALDYYRSALNIDPDSAAARGGLRSIAGKVLERAGSALIDAKVEDAVQAIETARDIDPQHPGLAFMEALAARERDKQTQAEDAGRRSDTLTADARGTTNRNRLVAPRDSSARDASLESRRPEPTSQGVTQPLADKTDRSIKAEGLAAPSPPSNRARPPDSANPSLAPMEGAQARASNDSAATRQSRAELPPAQNSPKPAPAAAPVKDAGKEMIENIRRLLSEDKLIDPPGENAKDALAMLRATDPGRAEINELTNTLSSRLLESSKQSLAAKMFERSQQLLTAARDVGVPGNDAAITQTERELAAARAGTTGSSSIVQASTLRRTKMVDPVYPSAARRRNEKGVVELTFTVTPNGSVDNIEVRKSNPARVFDDAAKQAVAQWQFEPVQVNGQAVPQRAVVRLLFSMD